MDFCVKLVCNDEVVIDGVFSGSFCDNIISYNDSVINIFDLNTLLLKRIYDDYSLVFDFNNCVCKYDGSLCFDIKFLLLDSRMVIGDLFLRYKIIDTGYIYEYSVKW